MKSEISTVKQCKICIVTVDGNFAICIIPTTVLYINKIYSTDWRLKLNV